MAAAPVTNALSDVIPRVTNASGEDTDTRVLFDDKLVALLFVDSESPRCIEACVRLEALVRAVASKEGSEPVVGVIVHLAGPVAVLEQLFERCEHLHLVGVAPGSEQLARLRVLCGTTAAMLVPELCFLHGTTGEPVWTDAAKHLLTDRIGSQTHTWPKNCAVVRAAPAPVLRLAGVSSHGCRLHPDTLLNTGLYPGDVARIKVVGRGGLRRPAADSGADGDSSAPRLSSVCMYVNASQHADDDTVGDEDVELGSLEPEPGSLWIAPETMHNLGVVDGDTVAMMYMDDVPPAKSICLTRGVTASELSEAQALEILHAHFGVESVADQKAVALVAAIGNLRGMHHAGAAAADQDEDDMEEAAARDAAAAAPSSAPLSHHNVSDNEVSWLRDHVRRSECIFAPLVVGQTVRAHLPSARADVEFVVKDAVPRFTAVLVSPDTHVTIA